MYKYESALNTTTLFISDEKNYKLLMDACKKAQKYDEIMANEKKKIKREMDIKKQLERLDDDIIGLATGVLQVNRKLTEIKEIIKNV